MTCPIKNDKVSYLLNSLMEGFSCRFKATLLLKKLSCWGNELINRNGHQRSNCFLSFLERLDRKKCILENIIDGSLCFSQWFFHNGCWQSLGYPTYWSCIWCLVFSDVGGKRITNKNSFTCDPLRSRIRGESNHLLFPYDCVNKGDKDLLFTSHKMCLTWTDVTEVTLPTKRKGITSMSSSSQARRSLLLLVKANLVCYLCLLLCFGCFFDSS